MNARRLKVEAEGDPWKKNIRPKIRLVGKWLEKMGFPPERHVEVSPVEPGVLQIRLAPECLQESIPPGSYETKQRTVRSLEHCVARLEHLEKEKLTAFSKAWREHCKREIDEWKAYIAEHYPDYRRSKTSSPSDSRHQRDNQPF